MKRATLGTADDMNSFQDQWENETKNIPIEGLESRYKQQNQ